MKINSRFTDCVYITCNGIDYAIRDEGKDGLRITVLDNEFSTILIKPNCANSINVKPTNNHD